MATAVAFNATHKDVRSLGEWAIHTGWTYTGINGNGHHTFRWKDGTVCVIPATPSDHRSLLNARSKMRRIMDWQSEPKTLRPPRRVATSRPPTPAASKPRTLNVLDAVVNDICEAAERNGLSAPATYARLVREMVHQRLTQ